jgi:hypothetical protein
MRHLSIGPIAGVTVGVTVIVIMALPIASWRTPASPEDRSDEFTFSEACVAEQQAVPQKMIDYQKSHGFWPPVLERNRFCHHRPAGVLE